MLIKLLFAKLIINNNFDIVKVLNLKVTKKTNVYIA